MENIENQTEQAQVEQAEQALTEQQQRDEHQARVGQETLNGLKLDQELSAIRENGYEMREYAPYNPPGTGSGSELQSAALEARAAILAAALKYRAVVRNRPQSVTLEAHMATDPRIATARARMEKAMLSAGLLELRDPHFALNLVPQGLQILTANATILIAL